MWIAPAVEQAMSEVLTGNSDQLFLDRVGQLFLGNQPKGASVDVGASLSGFSSDSAELSFRTDSTQAWTRLPMARDKAIDDANLETSLFRLGSDDRFSVVVYDDQIELIVGSTLATGETWLGIGPAVAVHEGSTLLVVFNALRLLAYRNPAETDSQRHT